MLTACSFRVEAAPVYELLSGAEPGPQRPQGGRMILQPDGNLYGVTSQGGLNNSGTLFQLTPNGEVKVLAHLWPLGAMFPRATLATDGFGQFWGTTEFADQKATGAIFKYNIATAALTKVATMADFQSGQQTGLRAGLARDGVGFLWGTRVAGGGAFLGNVFKVNVSSGAVTNVLQFTGDGATNRGSYPSGEMIADGGFMWGTTSGGGSRNCGTIYKIRIGTGALETVAEFTDLNAPNRGIGPRGPLLRDGQGNFWGVTDAGGVNGYGTIFKVNAASGVLTAVADFSGTAGPQRGAHPQGGLAVDGAGNAWGATTEGGSLAQGTVFRVNLATGALGAMADFGLASPTLRGSLPSGGLTADAQGKLWGMTEFGGTGGLGTVFKVDPSSGTVVTVVNWQSGVSGRGGVEPHSPVFDDGQGNLWGTMAIGGATGNGNVFKMDRISGKMTPVVDFTGLGGSHPGAGPLNAGLASDAAGNLWGVTRGGGLGYGTIFKVRMGDGAWTTMAQFTGDTGTTRGSAEQGGLIGDGAGNFWGTTDRGGANAFGVIFKINASTGAFTNVVDFTGTVGPAKGSTPTGRLVKDGAGNLWGTTQTGGAANWGTVFKINTATQQLTTVVEFLGTSAGPNRGGLPTNGLVYDPSGFLWGGSLAGGMEGWGTIFKVNAATGAMTTVIDFTRRGAANAGAVPRTGLTADNAGNLWGMTSVGGAQDQGTIFTVNKNTGVLTTVLSLNPSIHGYQPDSPFTLGGDGNLYGVIPYLGRTRTGLPAMGSVFRLRFGPTPVTLAATSVTSTGARLNGTLNPHGRTTFARFELSTSATFAGAQLREAGSLPAESSPIIYVLNITGLAPQTTYYFRARGDNSDNPIPQRGSILSFTTPSQSATSSN